MIDTKTIEDYYKENYDLLVKRYTFRCGSEMDAEDCIHDALVQAMKYRHSCREGEFPKWFSGILNNTLKDFKREQRLGGLVKDSELQETDGKPVFQTSRKELWYKEIHDAAKMKPEPAREILRLALEYGYGETDILRIVPNMTYAKVRYVLDCFKRELAARYRDDM